MSNNPTPISANATSGFFATTNAATPARTSKMPTIKPHGTPPETLDTTCTPSSGGGLLSGETTVSDRATFVTV